MDGQKTNTKSVRLLEKSIHDIEITFQALVDDAVYVWQPIVEEMVKKGFQSLCDGLPLVAFVLSQEGKFVFDVRCIVENSPQMVRSSPDLLTAHLPQTVSLAACSIDRAIFSINALQGRSFLCIHILAVLEDHASFRLLTEQLPILKKNILLSLRLPALCRQMIMAQMPSPHISLDLIGQELVKWFRYPKPTPEASFDELQRFFLATDKEFKKIRGASHLLKLVRSHLWLKQKHLLQKSPHGPKVRLFYRLFRSRLQFPFGAKDVVSLVISLHSLSPYEKFDHKHIILACKRCLPTLEMVPNSFYVYRYSEESTLSLYLELEKQDGSFPTFSEIEVLKKELGRELESSIEQVMSRIDIPHNEEDILRNFLLLSQQCRTTKDLTQVIIQFHGQRDASFDFQITLVRCVRKGHVDLVSPPQDPLGVIACFLLRSSIIDKLRTTHVKQGAVFLVQCSKKAFLRKDRSINFMKARESVVDYLESFLGKIRDLNGGLIYQQHQLLKSIQPLLSAEEGKEISIIEDLFHSLSPSVMKNILGPEHMVTIFRQFLALRRGLKTGSKESILIEEYSKEMFFAFVCPPSFVKEEVFQAQLQFQMAENELCLCTLSFEGYQLCFVLCLSQDIKIKEQFTHWLQKRIQEKKMVRRPQYLRISLSRPTLILDPRIGTDRTSGTVIKMLYEGLMRLDPNGNPTNAIAEEVRISNDGSAYTFILRPTFWTNGQKVTAHDFEYAWKKILEPSFNTVFDYLLHPIRNARLVKAGKLTSDALGIHAINDCELLVELEKPFPHFLELCCLWIYSPLCKNIDTTRPGWAYYGDHTYVCNGPFKLKKWSRNGGIVLVKNERYWDKERVSLEEIDISIIENPLIALQLFEQGELDWLGEPLSETPLCIFKRKSPDIHMQPMSAVQWYVLNVQHPPFCSAKVRRALSFALNRSAIVGKVLYGDERASHSILPASLSLLSDQEPLGYDLEAARRLFQEGLEEQGLTNAILKPIKMVVYDQEPHKTLARAVIHSWEQAFGISFVLEVVGWHEFFERIGGSTHDITAQVWYSWYKDPLYSLGVLQSGTNSINASRWSDDRLKKLLERVEGIPEKKQRNALLKEAEELVMQEMPIIPLVDYNSRYLKSESVDNVYVSHLGNVDFKWTTVTRPSATPAIGGSASLLSTSDEVRLYLQSEPVSLDPRIAGERRNQILIRELYEGLMRMGKNGGIELALAESVSVSDDKKTYTFRLRSSLWSNGMPVTAEDFAWTIRSALSPTFQTPFAYAFFSIKNASQAYGGKVSLDEIGVRVIDEKTLEITLERPVSYFLELIANPIYSPVCKAIAEDNPRWASEVFPKYVCNGPFVLKGHSPRSRIVLAKNPYYWNADTSKSECLSFQIIKDPQTAFRMFESGELDWYGDPFGNMSTEGFRVLQKKGSLMRKEGGGTSWLVCQTEAPHLKSSNIRKGLACAINRREICETVLQEGEYPTLTILPRFQTGLETPIIEDNCPDLALSFFEKGLMDLGITKDAYPPLIITHWSDPKTKNVVKMIQRQLQSVLGIRVETSLLDWNTHIKRLASGEFQMAIGCWFTWFQDPIYTLQYVKYKNNGINGTGFEHPNYIRLLDLADMEEDSAVRGMYLQQAESFIMNELPLIPLFSLTNNYANAPGVTGETFSSVGLVELKWIEKSRLGHLGLDCRLSAQRQSGNVKS